MSFDTGDETVLISRCWESRERPESSGCRIWVNLCWTFESNDSCSHIKCMLNVYLNWQEKITYLPDYISPVTDQANYNHEFYHHRPILCRMGRELVPRIRILSNSWNIHANLGRYRKRIRKRERWLVVDHGHDCHTRRPNCSCNDCGQRLCRRRVNHFRRFLRWECRWCIGRIDHSVLGARTLEWRTGRDRQVHLRQLQTLEKYWKIMKSIIIARVRRKTQTTSDVLKILEIFCFWNHIDNTLLIHTFINLLPFLFFNIQWCIWIELTLNL